jgi:hypothetical protein
MGLRRRKCRGHAPGASRRHVSLECVTTSARRATGVWRRPRAARLAARPWPQRTPCAANGPCRACSPGVSARFPRWPWSCRRGRAARRRPQAAGHGRGRQGACGSDARVRVVLRRHLRERELGFGGHCGGRKIPSVGLGPRGLTPPTLPGLLRRWRCVPMRACATGTAGCLPQRGTGGRSRGWRARGPQKRGSWPPRGHLGPHLDLESQRFATATACI